MEKKTLKMQTKLFNNLVINESECIHPSIIPSKGGYDGGDCNGDRWATMSLTY